jgi:hypothetical protein
MGCIVLALASHVHYGMAMQQSEVSFILMKKLRMPIAQSYMIDATFPMEYIRNQWKTNYHIVSLSHGDNGVAVIMNGGMIPQRIITSDTFPSVQIQDQLALGNGILSCHSIIMSIRKLSPHIDSFQMRIFRNIGIKGIALLALNLAMDYGHLQ